MNHLRRLGDRIVTKIRPDEEGFIGRECPKCRGYFKIVVGTGLKQEGLPCHCPYCGHMAEHHRFVTEDQIEYARSVARRKVSDAFRRDLKALEFSHKPSRRSGIEISLKVKHGQTIPIHRYKESQLETEIICTNCTLRYSVYGVFAFCPDCAQHNSLDILNANMDLVRKILGLARSQDQRELSEKLIKSALGECISAFDGFGREICRVYGAYARGSIDVGRVSFQNLLRSRKQILTAFEIDIAGSLNEERWNEVVNLFQKRHVIAHRMGVVDQQYVNLTGDERIKVGRKIVVDVSEAEELTENLSVIAEQMLTQFKHVGNES